MVSTFLKCLGKHTLRYLLDLYCTGKKNNLVILNGSVLRKVRDLFYGYPNKRAILLKLSEFCYKNWHHTQLKCISIAFIALMGET